MQVWMCGLQVALPLSSPLVDSSSSLRWVLLWLRRNYSFTLVSQGSLKWSRDEDHLRLITQTVGPLPMKVIEEGINGNKFYSGEKLKNVEERDINGSSIVKQLQMRKMQCQFVDLQAFSSWLHLLLAPDPRARATAYQSAKHGFLVEDRGKGVEDVVEVEEVIKTTSETLSSDEDNYLDLPQERLLIQKELLKQKEELVKLERKLGKAVNILQEMRKKQVKEKSVKMVQLLMEMKEKMKKRDQDEREEIMKLKETQDKLEGILSQQSAEIVKLKRKLEGKGEPSSHHHSTIKARKVDWAVSSSRAGQKKVRSYISSIAPYIYTPCI